MEPDDMRAGFEYLFHTPPYDAEEWDRKVEGFRGLEKELALTRKIGSSVVSEFDQMSVTSVSLAWLNLWTKLFDAIRVCEASYLAGSDLALVFLQRFYFEVKSDLYSISDPLQEENQQEIARRLEAYSAWAILSDLEVIRSFLREKHIRQVFDLSTQRNLIAKLGKKRKDYEALYGELEDISDSENKLDEERYRKNLSFQKKELESLLSNLGLKKWIVKYNKIKRSAGVVTFKSMIDVHDRDVSLGLYIRESDIPFYYPTYGKQSRLIHGSSMFSGSLRKKRHHIFPRMERAEDREEELIRSLQMIRMDFRVMELLRSRVLSVD